MSNVPNIVVPEDAIEEFCRKYHIRKLSFFGSVLSDRFRSDSDVDVLVEFEPEARVGLKFIEIQEELSQLLGRSVDLNTPGFLSRHFRQQVLDNAVVLYQRG
jgi:predicted nucleotidyltransferase